MPASQLATLSGTESAAASIPAVSPRPAHSFPHSTKPMESGGHREEPHLYRLRSSTEGMTPRHVHRCPAKRRPDPRGLNSRTD